MPLFYFYCNKCLKTFKKLLKTGQAAENQVCSCGNALVRDFQDLSLTMKNTIDNGIQSRRVEQYENAHEVIQERAENSKKNKNKKDL